MSLIIFDCGISEKELEKCNKILCRIPGISNFVYSENNNWMFSIY